MQPENPEPYSAPARAAWPTTAIPGRPGAHLCPTQADSATVDPGGGSASEAGPASGLEAIPDAEPTSGSELLDELRSQIAKFVIPPSSEALDAVTLWVVATHLQPGWYVTRVVGNDHTPHKFATFSMAAIAGIGDLPDTVMDRSVVIRMRRRAEGEKVKPFRSRRDIPALHELRDRIHAWARPLLEDAANLEPGMPVEDRAADTWEPLVTVADLAGGRWPRLARVACARMVAAEVAAEEDHPSGARILADIRRVFFAQREAESLSTEDLLHYLNADAEAPWGERGRYGLTSRELSGMLRDYDIRPGNVRMADRSQRKGYTRNKFLDVWRRYCPTIHPADAPRGEG
ncbi:DUF3631 domain-containing protein [Streptomyces pratensis]|uniref:DUF3631 domain-containing protein n=1 Tax=Streptomyces pratensis TaxID=1169025 RepID=UPI0037BBE699